jgi:hypothetical protein
MPHPRWLLGATLLLLLGAAAHADDPLVAPGAYEVRYRLELPNVLDWRADETATICLPRPAGEARAPIPVLSGNNPLAKCRAADVRRDGDELTFRIACEGRNAARALAVYRLWPDRFEGRIAMVMGGKNMTMTEVQHGRRVGECKAAP